MFSSEGERGGGVIERLTIFFPVHSRVTLSASSAKGSAMKVIVARCAVIELKSGEFHAGGFSLGTAWMALVARHSHVSARQLEVASVVIESVTGETPPFGGVA